MFLKLKEPTPSVMKTIEIPISKNIFGLWKDTHISENKVNRWSIASIKENPYIMQRWKHKARDKTYLVCVKSLGHSVPAINAKLRTSNVLRSIAKQESHGAHQILRCTHLSSRDKRSPFIAELGVLVENFAGTTDEGKPMVSTISPEIIDWRSSIDGWITHRAVSI